MKHTKKTLALGGLLMLALTGVVAAALIMSNTITWQNEAKTPILLTTVENGNIAHKLTDYQTAYIIPGYDTSYAGEVFELRNQYGRDIQDVNLVLTVTSSNAQIAQGDLTLTWGVYGVDPGWVNPTQGEISGNTMTYTIDLGPLTNGNGIDIGVMVCYNIAATYSWSVAATTPSLA